MTYRSKSYLKWVRSQDCALCGAPGPSDAHHLIGIGGMGGMGTKAPDSAVMPLCRGCHSRIHRMPELWPKQWEYIARTLIKAIEEGVI